MLRQRPNLAQRGVLSQKVQNCQFLKFLEWETVVYIWTFKNLIEPLIDHSTANYLWCYMYSWRLLFQVMISFGGLLEECLPCFVITGDWGTCAGAAWRRQSRGWAKSFYHCSVQTNHYLLKNNDPPPHRPTLTYRPLSKTPCLVSCNLYSVFIS